ncbi:MAG: DUF2339 domain-containing protein [Candidatus Peregrinibacteria bacterium]|nr:DUF2339 domain-containing protein [Candidatus Peregrinibacteria bacterium]
MDIGFLILLLVIAAIFYFLVLPVLVFRLQSRVRELEERLQGKVPALTKQALILDEEEQEFPRAARAAERVPEVVMERKVGAKPEAPSTHPEHSLEVKVGGNLFQWIGIAALVLALLFFLKWSFENNYIGPTGRTIIGYVLSGAAIVAGDRLRKRYGTWSLAFTGGGALGSYIVTWIALHSYHLFPSAFAFLIYVLTTFVVCTLAGYYGSLPLAAFGILGGFITPVLTDQSGSTLSLLLYILILDVGVFLLGHMRQWRGLNALTLIGTGIYEIIAYMDYQFTPSQAYVFIGAFLVIYMLVPIVYNLLKQQKSEAPDIFILIGNALLHFSLTLAWLEKTPGIRSQYDAFVALGYAALFLVFSSEVYRRNRVDTPLVLGSLSLTILFASLAIPLQFGGVWVPLAWSIEGAFLLWMALALKDKRIQTFAWIVMIAAYIWYFMVPVNAGSSFLGGYTSTVFLPTSFLLYLLWAGMFVAVGGLALTRSDRKEHMLFPFMLLLACGLGVSLFTTLFVRAPQTFTAVHRFIEAAALVGGGYAVLLQARAKWSDLSEDERSMFGGLGIAVQIVTLTYLTNEFAIAVRQGKIFVGNPRAYQYLQVGISILWAAYGSITLVVGVMKNIRPLRLFSIALLLIAIGKLTLIDFFSLGTGARVIGLTIVGALLVSASFLYQRKRDLFTSLLGPSSSSK